MLSEGKKKEEKRIPHILKVEILLLWILLNLYFRKAYQPTMAIFKNNFRGLMKNLAWLSHDFLLPYITTEGNFVISVTSIFNLLSVIFHLNSLTWNDSGCSQVISNIKLITQYPRYNDEKRMRY